MAEKTLLDNLASVYGVSFIAPIFGGMVLTVFKHLFKSEDELSKDFAKIKQDLLETLCQSFTRLVPPVSDSFRDVMQGQPSEKDILSVLRGETKGQTDLCFEHFKTLSITCARLGILDRLKLGYRRCHTWMLITVIGGIGTTLIAFIFPPTKGYCALLGITFFVVQVVLVIIMRRTGNAMDELGQTQ